jgi:hypothetical protein
VPTPPLRLDTQKDLANHMTEVFDFEEARQAVVAADNFLEIDDLPADRSKIDSGDRDAIFRCDIPGGVSVQGNGSLIVEGSVKGTEGNGCRIAVLGDALVDGTVEHSHLNAATIRGGGAARHSDLAACNDIMLGAFIAQTRCTVGDFQNKSKRVDELQRTISSAGEDQEGLERQIKQQDRRVGRACKTTRSPLDFNVQRIVQHGSDRVSVDLTSFAESLGESTDRKFALALNEFFAKGIVGILVRTNSQYVSDNLSREKVFLQLLKGLRELFLMVGKRDRGREALQNARSELDQILETLGQDRQSISVGGEIEAGSALRFLLPIVKRRQNGEIEIEEKSASAGIGAAGPKLGAQLISVAGVESTQALRKKDLTNTVFSFDGDAVRWAPIESS